MLIIGAGQYGKVAKEVAESMGCFEKIAFLDDNSDLAIGKLDEYEKFVSEYTHTFVAIGRASLRLTYIKKLEEARFKIATLISPKSYVSSSAKIMKGTIIEPMAVVNSESTICAGVYVCAGAIVNHNALVGEGSQLDCGSVVGSNAVFPSETKLKYNEVWDRAREVKAIRCPQDSNMNKDCV